MARIAGIDLPKNKKVLFALQYIHGIGPTVSKRILTTVKIDPDKKIKDLSDDEVSKIRKEIDRNYKVEGTLRADTQANIKRLIEIGSYRGIRHQRGLPARGQRTRTNARTRKGPKKAIGRKKGG
ncbi:MAG TPA: 30S ribosomal protein S13 [bacterium (Candidatus Stahlbacteria)]|nr:30S ribosomal protein S13 [Candidatus Stahlbacteria bacterium]